MHELNIVLPPGQTASFRMPLLSGKVPALLTGYTYQLVIAENDPIDLEIRAGDSSLWLNPADLPSDFTSGYHVINRIDSNDLVTPLFDGKTSIE